MREMNESPPFALPASCQPPRRWLGWLGVVLALAGWWLSFDLARLSSGSSASIPWLQTHCGPRPDHGLTDCLSVLRSGESGVSILGSPRIPVAVLGMAYFGFVGLWYLFVGSPTRRRWAWHLFILAVVGLGVLQSVFYMHLMKDVLHRWCPGCVAVHVVNLALALLTLVAIPWRRDPADALPHPTARLAGAALVGGACLFLLHLALALFVTANTTSRRMYQEYRAIVEDPAYVRWTVARQPVHPELLDPGRPCAGDPRAPNLVVVFSDFRCPACRRALALLADVIHDHPGALRVDYRHYPLDRSCNPDLPRTMHTGSCRAAEAAEAARLAGSLEQYERLRAALYEHQDELEMPEFPRWAAAVGLDATAFARAMDSDRVRAQVKADIALARRVGVENVPVLFLNGRRLPPIMTAQTWEALLAAQPAEAPATAPAAAP